MKVLFCAGSRTSSRALAGSPWKIRADLVEFVEEDDGVAALDAAEGLDDSARQRADVGAAVAADFRLVAQAAEGDAGELAPEGIGDAFAEGGFADAGRADEAEDGAFEFLLELDDGEEFEEAVFDFGQAEVLFVEDALGFGEVNLVLGLLQPRQVDDPVEVMAGEAVFGHGGGHLREALQFLHGDFAGFGREFGFLDAFAEGFDFGVALLGVAEFALDGVELFAQEEVALRFGEGGGDFGLDFGSQVQQFHLAVQKRQELLEAVLDGVIFEELLAFVEGEVEVGGDEVGEEAGALDVEGGELDLLGEAGGLFDDFLKVVVGVAGERGELHGFLLGVAPDFEVGAEVGLLSRVIFDADAPEAFDEDADGVVGEFQHLEHSGRAPVLEHLLRFRIVRRRILLQRQPDEPVAVHRVVNELDAARRLDQQRADHAGEEHDVRKAEDGQEFRQRPRGDACRWCIRAAFRTKNADELCFGVGGGHRWVWDSRIRRLPKRNNYKAMKIWVGLETVCSTRGTSSRRKPF